MSHRKSRAAPVPTEPTEPILRGVAATARCAYSEHRRELPAMDYWAWYTTALIDRLGGILPDLAFVVVTEDGSGFELGPQRPGGPDWFIECTGGDDGQYRVVTVSAESDEVLDTVLSLVAMMRATLAH